MAASSTAAANQSPERAQNAPAGIGLMLLAVFVFSLNDVLGKWLAGTYSVGQILVFRSIAALVVLAPFAWRIGWQAIARPKRPGLQLLRVLFSTGEVACFYAAVSVLPLADAMTYYLAGPIFVTVLAALILKEAVGWRRWTAIIIGFAGVVIALQPSASAFGWPAFVALAGSIFFAFLMIVTRYLRGTPDEVMIFWQMCGALVFGVAMAPFHWVPFAGFDPLLIGVVGVVSMVAFLCVNRSLALAPASVVVPYQYTLIIWAIVFGYFAFGDVPSVRLLIGAAIIIGAGLFIFIREQRLGKPAELDLPPER